LFDDAIAMRDSKELRTMINAAKTRDYSKNPEVKERGVVGGPKRIIRKVDAGGQQHVHIKLKAGEPATVALTSDHPVRIILKQGGSTLSNNVVTNFRYTWRASKAKVSVEVHGMGKVAHFTVYAN